MAEERLQRGLAAIMSADVVGHSRLMGTDEAGTLSRLNILRRELIDPMIAAHSGRIVKLMGDGAVVEFASAVDAVTWMWVLWTLIGCLRACSADSIRNISASVATVIVDVSLGARRCHFRTHAAAFGQIKRLGATGIVLAELSLDFDCWRN
jgi:hypothetical protein